VGRCQSFREVRLKWQLKVREIDIRTVKVCQRRFLFGSFYPTSFCREETKAGVADIPSRDVVLNTKRSKSDPSPLLESMVSHQSLVVDSILNAISRLPDQSQPGSTFLAASTQSRLPDTIKPILNLPLSGKKDAQSLFMTLHVLFPHDLIPALDILDRQLVTELRLERDNQTSLQDDGSTRYVFYVQSASAVTEHAAKSKPSTSKEVGARYNVTGKYGATQTYYEVDLDSWNCTCAAFAFSALLVVADSGSRDLMDEKNTYGDMETRQSLSNETRWRFGGAATQADADDGVPVCKHILAVVLTEAAPELFSQAQYSRAVSRGEMAGWATT
jgi:hypothetical protein